jgi:hypothetical protein
VGIKEGLDDMDMKIFYPTGTRTRTPRSSSVASHCTDWAIAAL